MSTTTTTTTTTVERIPNQGVAEEGGYEDQGRNAKILLHLAFLATLRQDCGHFTT